LLISNYMCTTLEYAIPYPALLVFIACVRIVLSSMCK